MRKLPAFALAGVTAAALAGTAIAASPKTRVMNVPLPDGSVARVEYVGDVAPKVSVSSRPAAGAIGDWAGPFPSFADFGRMIEQMHRQSEEMIRRAQSMPQEPAGAAPYIASYGNMPAGQTSTTIVTVSNNGETCTRSTEIVSQGAGKPPKVTSHVTGKCDAATAQPSEPINRT